ncbi:MAG: fibronectin type III domain-containing protein [Chitinivibrionia bacterium]|nr:fibronectin type III domain-containing protein [Chitinivibrionia bacterium]
MKKIKIVFFALSLGLLLSCSLEPYGPTIADGLGGDGIGAIPSVPTGVFASATSSSSIRIQWNAVSDATRYNIYRSTTATGTFSFVNFTTSTSFTDTGLPASTTRHYRVSAENSRGESARSNAVSATTSASTNVAPTTPTGVSASAQSTTSIRVQWNAVSGATHYRVEVATSSSGPWGGLTNPILTGTAVNITGLTRNTTYWFRVRAENNVGNSSWSTAISARTFN